jgi:hypothetical protein
MRAAALLLILGGCDQLFDLDPLKQPDPESDVDAQISKVIDAATECSGGAFYGSYGPGGTGLLRLCLQSPAPSLALTGDIDTTEAANCTTVAVIDDVGTEICVKFATTIGVASIRATGSRGLVLVAADTMAIDGTIDVSSRQLGGYRGAGGNWPNCQPSAGKSSSLGGSGGAGGSFGTRGGNGGANASGAFTGSKPTALPDRVRGGCEGGNGGDGASTYLAGGFGGKSGGAVYLVAGNMISFADTAVVNASGMGGRAGGTAHYTASGGGGGGGGGGSGGLIGLDAPNIRIGPTTKFFANGGGGGGASSVSTSGTDGADPKASAITTPAAGGQGTVDSGKGGAGAVKNAGAVGGSTSKAGGGGGGGVGHIVIFTPNLPTTGQFSPAPAGLNQ